MHPAGPFSTRKALYVKLHVAGPTPRPGWAGNAVTSVNCRSNSFKNTRRCEVYCGSLYVYLHIFLDIKPGMEGVLPINYGSPPLTQACSRCRENLRRFSADHTRLRQEPFEDLDRNAVTYSTKFIGGKWQ